MIKNDYVAAIARAAAPRLGPFSTPTAIMETTDAAIRLGIAEYRRLSETPNHDRLSQEWMRGMLTGIAVTLVGMFAGGLLLHLLWRV